MPHKNKGELQLWRRDHNSGHPARRISPKFSKLPKTGPIAPSYLIQSKGRLETRNSAMKTNTRFIKSVVAAAAKNDTVMPWTRGAARAAFIAKRNATAPQERKSA
jgi:hypothetical protein